MKNILRDINFSLVLLAYAIGAFAQDGHQWPRNQTSGKVEYRGSLPWPAGIITEAQRRDLVRHWYLTKLTDVKPEDVAYSIAHYGITYDGLPRAAQFDYSTYEANKEYFNLSYDVELTLTSTGLAYRLSNFGYSYFSIDVGSGDDLEDILTQFSTGRPDLAVFQKRLVAALAGW